MAKNIYTTHSSEETKKLAVELATSVKGGEFIALVGDLGAGKTTFVQGLAAALGSSAKVKSPTFTLMNVYPTAHPTIKQIVHVDFYRVPNASVDLALAEYCRNDTIIVAEWPGKTELKKRSLMISFALGASMNERTIKIER